MLNEHLARELLGKIAKKQNTLSSHVKQTALNNPVDAKWAADMRAAGQGS